MKIGILTVPFNNNYGGFLQAYALKTAITKTGNEVIFIRRERPRKLWWDFFDFIKWLCGKGDYVFFRDYKKMKASKYTTAFQNHYLSPMTEKFYKPITYNSIKKYGIDRYIVGSDQVWRYKYAQSSILNYFFDFLYGTNIPRMSYAASFGGNNEDFPKDSFALSATYLNGFRKVLVRENDAVKYIEKENCELRGKVKVVVDPTMLLTASDYRAIFEKYKPLISSGDSLFSYILDESRNKSIIEEQISRSLNLDIVRIKAGDPTLSRYEEVMPVEEWLFHISKSQFVVTDSFHGTVFSIIFHRPFIVFANQNRGQSRLNTLLGSLGLRHRLVTDNTMDMADLDIQFFMNQDWVEVDNKLNILRSDSIKELYEGIGYE